MKCKECKACDHELCTINVTPYLLKKSMQVGCSLNHIQVDYHIRELAPTNREWMNSLTNDEFVFYFLDAICDYVQEKDKEWCRKQEKCTGCIEKWLKAKHIDS